MSYVSAASFYSTDPEMTTIVHRAHGNHPKFFVVKCYGVDLLFYSSDSGVFSTVPKLY